MTLHYDFVTKYYGYCEAIDEQFYDTRPFDFEVDVTFDTIKDFIHEVISDKVDDHTLEVCYESDLFINLEDDEDFIDWIKGVYYEEAFSLYKEG